MTCRRAAELISEELDTNLPLRQQIGLGFHTLLCVACRRYRRQIGVVEEAVEEFLESAAPGNSDATLSASSKEHLKVVIGARLDEES
jgi:hypothetical protein